MAEQQPQPAPKRRWLRFSLRGLLVALTMFGVWWGYLVNSAQRQKQAVAEIRKLGKDVFVLYDFQHDDELEKTVMSCFSQNIPPSLPDRLGLDLFYNVVEVHIAGGATDETLKQVAKLTHLRSFSCVPNGFTDEGVAYLAALRNLKTLQLGVHSPILGRVPFSKRPSSHLPVC